MKNGKRCKFNVDWGSDCGCGRAGSVGRRGPEPDENAQALIPEELSQVNLDIPSAVVTVLGALPEIRRLRPQIAEQLPKFDLELFDSLEDAAVALNELHAEFLIANRPTDDLQQLLDEATSLREQLLADATSLAKRGLIDGQGLTELKGPVGYKNLAVDLNMLQKTVRFSWAQIQGKSPITEAELDRASKLQMRLMRVVGLREQGPVAVAAATDLRQRAYAFFLRAYDHAQRAVTYLRWNEEDADSIAPSLYSGRGAGRRKSTEPGTTPGSTPGNGGAPTGAAPGPTPISAGGPAAATPITSAPPAVPEGSRGSSGGAVGTRPGPVGSSADGAGGTSNTPGGDPFLA